MAVIPDDAKKSSSPYPSSEKKIYKKVINYYCLIGYSFQKDSYFRKDHFIYIKIS